VSTELTDNEIIERLKVLESWRADVNGTLHRIETLARRRVMTPAQKDALADLIVEKQRHRFLAELWESGWKRTATVVGVLAGIVYLIGTFVAMIHVLLITANH